MKNNAIDDIFKKDLGDLEVASSDHAWNQLNDLLSEEENSSTNYRILFWSILGLIALLFLSWFYLFNSTDENYPSKNSIPMAVEHNVKSQEIIEIEPIINSDRVEDSIASEAVLVEETKDIVQSQTLKAPRLKQTLIKASLSQEIMAHSIEVKQEAKKVKPRDSKLNPLIRTGEQVKSKSKLELQDKKNQVVNVSTEPIRAPRTLVVNLDRDIKRDTVILKSPDPKQDAKKSLMTSIRDFKKDDGLLQKVRNAKQDIFNNKQ